MLGHGIGISAQRWPAAMGNGVGSGTGTGGGTGPTLAGLPALPTSRWHPAFSVVTEAAGRVVSASDLRGVADVSEGAPGIGPRVMTDPAGNTFWRFEGAEYLDIAAGLVSDSRDISVFLVGRVPRIMASPTRFVSLGNRNQGTQRNTLNGPLEVRMVSESAGHLQSFGKLAYTAASGGEAMVAGTQLQVMGAATSAEGTRLYLNEATADVAVPYNVTDIVGGEIGRYAWSTGRSGNWAHFDLYELVIYAPGLDTATAAQVSQALMSAHSVAPVQNQLVLEGDSIMQGVLDVGPSLSSGAVLTEPGASTVPADWRVVNKGTSGSTVSNLVIRRDKANGWPLQILPGRNVMAFEIGRNDWSGQTAVEHYANVVAYLNTPGTGVLQRGWEVRVMANIATAPGFMLQTDAFRTMLRDPQFLIDCDAGPGQIYDGLVSIVSTDLIEDQGQAVFQTSADAANLTYYSGDSTHPNVLGARLRMLGGDTLQHGLAWGL